jgi:redox-sensing transcriptional repressor
MAQISNKAVGRLSLYRRILNNIKEEGHISLYSHQLAALAKVSPAQVRRDIMFLGYTGTPAKGYDVEKLLQSIRSFLDNPIRQRVALVGIGNLGRAIMSYFVNRRPKLTISAAFDTDPEKVNRVINGCRCYPISELENVIRAENIKIGIISVPASEAQNIAELLIGAGVNGILNFAPTRLNLPPNVYVEDNDITMSLEIVAYHSRNIDMKKENTE